MKRKLTVSELMTDAGMAEGERRVGAGVLDVRVAKLQAEADQARARAMVEKDQLDGGLAVVEAKLAADRAKAARARARTRKPANTNPLTEDTKW